MGGVVGIVENHVRFELHDFLDVEVALRINGVGSLHQLRRDVFEHRFGDGRLERTAEADDIRSFAAKVGHVGRKNRNLVDDHAGDFVGDFDLVAAMIDDRMRAVSQRGTGHAEHKKRQNQRPNFFHGKLSFQKGEIDFVVSLY